MKAKNDEMILGFAEKHLQTVFSYALRMTDNLDAAKKITKKAFLKTVVNLEKLTSESMIKIYMFKLAVSYSNIYLKDNPGIDLNEKSSTLYDDNQKLRITDPTTDPFENTAADELSKAIRNAVKALPSVLKQVYVLHDVCGLTYREISFVLNTGEENVITNIKKARGKIKTYLFDIGSFSLE